MKKKELLAQLDCEISRLQSELGRVSVVSENYKVINDRIAELIQQRNELKDKSINFESLAKIGVSIAGLAATIWGTVYTVKFEHTDGFTTGAGRFFAKKIIDQQ